MKLFVKTFGCQMNVADSEEMSRRFFARGVTPAETASEADIVLVNTCTVRQHAENRALSYLGRLKQWKSRGPSKMLIVAGCAAERLKGKLKHRFPHVDLVAGAKEIEQFPQIIDKWFESRPAFDWMKESEESFGAGELRTAGAPFRLGNEKDTAFVTIMRGCNYSCSYCIVPSVRGREIYLQPENILQEIKDKIALGAKEVMLLGQTVNSYWHRRASSNGKPDIMDFADLLTETAAIDGAENIRFMSPHPHYMSDKLIRVLGSSPKFSASIHLPMQSGSDKMLLQMKRNYTRSEYIQIAQKLRAAVPALQLSTDFIVGFPGESEEDFAETLSICGEIKFGAAYCFKYSPRAGTESCSLPDEPSDEVKEERLARLLEKVNR